MAEETGTERSLERLFDQQNEMIQRLVRLETKAESAATMLTAVQASVTQISQNGCSRASQHSDHEDRLRILEGRPTGGNAVAGVAAAGGGGGLLGAAIMWLIQFLSR